MVNMIRCAKGHYYDASKYMNCPHCNANVAVDETTAAVDIDIKPPFDGVDPEKTIGARYLIDFNNSGNTAPNNAGELIVPVVGWLVCIEGELAGKDFRLCAGKNYIGRAADNDVVLDKDQTVSGRRHAIVSFDKVACQAYCHPGESRELFYLNGRAVYNPTQLHTGDVLTIGNTKLIYVPFYGEVFKLVN